ncbi:MAG TPA: ribosome biogenesis GTP-binding protein YihA/YsxC [Geobacteraceae bacterium]|nr:ribosome biogenesis GTP-binding protein YihA/YsxC [Geobacteraceae bacterium]
MIIKSTTFIKSAVHPEHYPAGDLPEVAFAGRSNVGKSSLINVLVNRKNLVRTSSTPGRTQLINFFEVNNRMMLVDLPGYGFARAPVAVRKQWGPMMETYLSSRGHLRGVILILDIRRTPCAEDKCMLEWLAGLSIPAIPVITKCDKVSRNEKAKQSEMISQVLGVPKNRFTYFSALSKAGRDDVWERIERLLGDVTAESPPITE